MARIRTIKPEFWTDSKTGTLSDAAKVVFLALWNHADDYGVIENDPLELCARMLPHRTTPVEVCLLSPLAEIAGKKLIEHFTFEEKPYIFIRNFAKHQVINKPSNPLLPDFDKHPTPSKYFKAKGVLPDPSGSTPGALPDSSTLPEYSRSTPVGKEGKGRERNGGERSGAERKWSGTERPDLSTSEAEKPPSPLPPPLTAPAPAPPATIPAKGGNGSDRLPSPPDYRGLKPCEQSVSDVARELGLADPLAPDPKAHVLPDKDETERRRQAVKRQLDPNQEAGS